MVTQTRGWSSRNVLREQVPSLVAATGTSFLWAWAPQEQQKALESHKVLLWAPPIDNCVTIGICQLNPCCLLNSRIQITAELWEF